MVEARPNADIRMVGFQLASVFVVSAWLFVLERPLRGSSWIVLFWLGTGTAVSRLRLHFVMFFLSCHVYWPFVLEWPTTEVDVETSPSYLLKSRCSLELLSGECRFALA